MGTTEQMWFVIAIGGFMVFLEGALSWIVKVISKIVKRDFSEYIVKVIAGIIIFIIAIIYLFNITPGT